MTHEETDGRASTGITSRVISRPRADLDAENEDPYVLGWDAGANMEEPPPCPYKDGMSAHLWRKGFSARVDLYIANIRKKSGLHASLT